jgi:hypothetical protein
MAIIFIPYIGVPLYIILGGRKMISKTEAATQTFIRTH